MRKPYSETTEERRERARRERKYKRAIFVSIEDADTLRDFAASLNLYTPRGPMAGQIGSMEALVVRFAQALRANPDRLLDILNTSEPPAS